MGKITINEIHKSLFGYIQAVSDESLETKDKTIVGAINELIQNSNSNKTEINNLTNEISNGKQLIANAIGEPLTAEDSFNEMSDDINGLLSTFKTNMMKNGVSIAGSDKFKQLIDKIATMVEEGSGNGIQFAEGTFTANEYNLSDNKEITINYSPGFIPDYVFVNFEEIIEGYDGYYINNLLVSNLNTSEIPSGSYSFSLSLSNITKNSFKINCENYYSVYDKKGGSWYAIGVGEKDTTLSGGLDIISATELPATGIENQICVVTDNPVNAFITTTNFDDTNNVSNDYITLYLGNTASSDATEGTLIELNQGNLLSRYYFVKACQGENRLDSYYWLNNQWNRLTQSGIYFVENGVERNHNYFGGIPSGNAAEFNSNGLTLLYSYSSPFKQVTTKNTINFSLYDKLGITIKNPNTSTSYYVCVGYASTEHFTSQGWYPTNNTGGNQPTYNNVTDAHVEMQATRGQTINQTIDISSWTGEGWLFLATYNGSMDLYITDLKLY